MSPNRLRSSRSKVLWTAASTTGFQVSLGIAGQLGRVGIGLGLIILALQLIVQAAAPITHAQGVKVLFASLTGDILLDALVGALFAPELISLWTLRNAAAAGAAWPAPAALQRRARSGSDSARSTSV